MSKLNLNKPLSVLGSDAAIIHKFNSKRVAVLIEGEQLIRTFQQSQGWGMDMWHDINDPNVVLTNKPTRVVKYVAFYPQTGAVYEQGNSPIKTSMYGLDQIVQIKLTYEGDRLIAKELV